MELESLIKNAKPCEPGNGRLIPGEMCSINLKAVNYMVDIEVLQTLPGGLFFFLQIDDFKNKVHLKNVHDL